MPLCTVKWARLPMISSRQVRSKPFITESTVMISQTPAAMPTTQMPVITEMKVWRRFATR